MGGFGDAIKYLYSQFILRDLLSFITPGAIVSTAALMLLWEEWWVFFDFIHSHWPLYIIIFGVFYVVGFAVQCFGEIVGLIRIHRIARSCWVQRFKVFGCNWACKRDKQDKNKCDEPDFIWWNDAHKEAVAFNECTQSDEMKWAQQQDERLVVLMQMCGNGFLSIIIATTLIIAHHFCQQGWHWLLVFWAVVLLVSLLWGYRVHVLRQDTMTRAIRESKRG